MHGVGDKGNHFAYLHSTQIHRLAAKPDDQQAGAVHNQGHKGHHGNHGAVGEQLGFHQIGVRFVKALLLKGLAAEGADGHNAGQDLAADKVQPVNKSLHQLKLGQCHAHQESNQQQQGSHCHKDDPFQTGVALGNVQDTADAQNGSVGDHTQQDNADKLYLLNVVGGAGNQRCCGEFFNFGVGIANHGAKHVAPQITTDGSRYARRKKTHRNGNSDHYQCQRQHPPAGAQQIGKLHIVGDALRLVFQCDQQGCLLGKIIRH